MGFLKDVKKLFGNKMLFLVLLLFVVLALGYYSSSKGVFGEYMDNKKGTHAPEYSQSEDSNPENEGSVQPSSALGTNGGFAQVSGMSGTSVELPSKCSQESAPDPSALLPKDQNNAWSQLNPSGNGALDSVNLLKAGYHIGIDTVGQALRNSNQQLRSEPANPQINVGPWNNSTIEPDVMRVPLEIGERNQ
jgi:hypothetical protein|tara:strand:+ start:539 stop:1111 length:573 start_codon:yes stop_codon:yes gene_type:complete